MIRRAASLLNYTLASALKLSKIAENLSQVSRIVRHYSLRRLGLLFRGSLDWPAKHQSSSVTHGWLQSALGRHKCLPSYELRGSPHQRTLIWNSQLVFWCGRRRIYFPNRPYLGPTGKWNWSTTTTALKMETVSFYETLASTYDSTWRHNPEEQHRYPHRREHQIYCPTVFLEVLRKVRKHSHHSRCTRGDSNPKPNE
jgi:hypothetical protein